jgi:hypothetical protein
VEFRHAVKVSMTIRELFYIHDNEENRGFFRTLS